MKDLIEEAERWDLEPKSASLWWTGTYADEKMEDMLIKTKTGVPKLPFEKVVRDSGITFFNSEGKVQDSLEERMESANKAWWRDATIYRSEDAPWRITCRRMVDQVRILFWGATTGPGVERSWTELKFGRRGL